MTMIGIDPHKQSHTAVAIDDHEVVLDEFRLRASSVQADRLRDWAARFDRCEWAVESANGLGYLLAQQLVAAGEVVFDVPPVLASRVRVLGSDRSQKNDPNDARSVAIAALRSNGLGRVRPDDHARVLRLLAKRHRDMAQLRNKHCTRLHALLGDLAAGGIGTEITVSKANTVLDAVIVDSEASRHRVLIATELVDDIARLDTILKASKKRVEQAVSASGTTLTSIVGIGPINAATILGYSGDIERFTSKAQFASYNGTAPIEASSGGRVRHRLNPRGNRKINHALHVAAICQLRYEDEGRTYFDRKIAEGKSSKEAIRALKRRISDRVFRIVVNDARRTQTNSGEWAREDNQERHEIQRDRLYILNSQLFGKVTPGPDNQRYDPPQRRSRGSSSSRPVRPPKLPLDTKRLRYVRARRVGRVNNMRDACPDLYLARSRCRD